MNPLKKLASQTAIYGLPTIVGRLLNYFLTPFYTYNLFSEKEFGDVTTAYAYVSFLLVFLTYGMETTLFNFSQNKDKKDEVYSTVLVSLLISSFIFLLVVNNFTIEISNALTFSGHPEYVVWFSIILAADAISAIPFAQLRLKNNAKRYAVIRSINIALNIGFNLFFLFFLKNAYESEQSVLKPIAEELYDPTIGIGYIFISNLIASVAMLLMLLPDMLSIKLRVSIKLWGEMLVYSIPLLIAGLAGMINETLDRALIPHLIPGDEGKAANGIYGACYKVAMLMTIFIQAYRYAAEPFFFNNAKNSDSRKNIAEVMKYFVIICSVIFLGTMVNMAWIQYFIGPDFREGLKVVPILLIANIFFGIFVSQSIWYKLSGKTMYGAVLTIFGALITLALNAYLVPNYGYIGAAWTTLTCYVSMTILSYILGNKHYPVNYDLKRILGYLSISISLFIVSSFIEVDSSIVELILKNLVLLFFGFIVWTFEFRTLLNNKE